MFGGSPSDDTNEAFFSYLLQWFLLLKLQPSIGFIEAGFHDTKKAGPVTVRLSFRVRGTRDSERESTMRPRGRPRPNKVQCPLIGSPNYQYSTLMSLLTNSSWVFFTFRSNQRLTVARLPPKWNRTKRRQPRTTKVFAFSLLRQPRPRS